MKVMKYLDYIQTKEDNSADKALSILSSVSDQILNEVYRDYYG